MKTDRSVLQHGFIYKKLIKQTIIDMVSHNDINPLWTDTFAVPDNLILVSENVEIRNNEEVRVIRFQEEAPMESGKAHVTFVVSKEAGELLVFVNALAPNTEDIINEEIAFAKANEIMLRINPEFYRGLSYSTVEILTKNFTDADGNTRERKVFRVKYSHTNNSLNWVEVAAAGNVEEYEIHAHSDYVDFRRKTDMWDENAEIVSSEIELSMN